MKWDDDDTPRRRTPVRFRFYYLLATHRRARPVAARLYRRSADFRRWWGEW